MTRFLKHVRRSLDRHPRKIFVIYYDPISAEQFTDAGFREIGSEDLDSWQFLPSAFYTRLAWFELNTFRNRMGKEFAIYLNAT